MECFKCGISDQKAALYDVITREGLIKLCDSCSRREDSPIIRKPTVFQLKEIERKPTNDLRSYSISSQKIKRELGWQPRLTLLDAIRSLIVAFDNGEIPNPEDPKYTNIKTMQKLNIS